MKISSGEFKMVRKRNALVDIKKVIRERAYLKWLDGWHDPVKNWIEAEREILGIGISLAKTKPRA